METDLRNSLLTSVSAMQAIVGVMVKRAAASDPGFKDEVRSVLMAGMPNADATTAEETRKALERILSLT